MYLGTVKSSFGHYFGHYFGQYLGTIWALCPAEKAEDWGLAAHPKCARIVQE